MTATLEVVERRITPQDFVKLSGHRQLATVQSLAASCAPVLRRDSQGSIEPAEQASMFEAIYLSWMATKMLLRTQPIVYAALFDANTKRTEELKIFEKKPELLESFCTAWESISQAWTEFRRGNRDESTYRAVVTGSTRPLMALEFDAVLPYNFYKKVIDRLETLTCAPLDDQVVESAKFFRADVRAILNLISNLRVAVADCRRTIVEANSGLVGSIVRQISGDGSRQDDLLSVGREGLIRAVEDFNPFLGNQFSTYAFNWIRSMVCRELGRNRHGFNVPENVNRMGRRLSDIQFEVRGETGRNATNLELATMTGSSLDLVDRARAAVKLSSCVSLDFSNNDGRAGLHEAIPAAMMDLDAPIDTLIVRKRLQTSLEVLSELGRDVLCLRFGIPFPGSKHRQVQAGDLCSSAEIAEILKIKNSKVRDLERRAVGKLAGLLRGGPLEEYISA